MQSVEIRYSLNVDAKSIIKDITEGIDPKGIAGALLFLAPDIELHKVCQYFDDKFTYAGCTVSNSFCSNRPENTITSQTAMIIYFFGSRLLASGFLGSFPKSKNKFFCFTTHEMFTREYLHLKMIGGIASGSIARDKPAVWCNDVISYENAVAISLPDVSLVVDVAHGWTPISNHNMKITMATDTIIYELDDQNAAKTYTSYVHDTNILQLYPLYSANKKKFVTIISVNANTGSLQLSQPVEEGDEVTLSSASRHEVLNATNFLVSNHHMENTIYPPELVFFISCSSREWLLCEDPGAEFLKVLPMFAREKVALIYLDGEFTTLNGRTEHLDHSIVMAKIYNAESEKLSEI